MVGRPPKPTSLKILAGNPGKRPLNDAEPQPDRIMPEMPKGMSYLAKREWKWMSKALFKIGLLTSVDGKALAMYCESYATWEWATKEKRKHGLLVEEPILDKEGMVVGTKFKANPAVHIEFNAAKTCKAFLTEFGMTPASRSRLKIEKPKEEDPLDAIMNRRGMQQTPQAVDQAPTPIAFDAGIQDDGLTNFDA